MFEPRATGSASRAAGARTLRRRGDQVSAFLSTHHITDARGAERHVVLTGRGLRKSHGGELTALGGLFVDITPTVTGRAREHARRDIETAAEDRGPIERAKGVLVAAFGVGPDAALARLERTSSLKTPGCATSPSSSWTKPHAVATPAGTASTT